MEKGKLTPALRERLADARDPLVAMRQSELDARIAAAVAARDAEWRTALHRMVQPECPASPGTPNQCDPFMCDCLSPMQECKTIEECVEAVHDALTGADAMHSTPPAAAAAEVTVCGNIDPIEGWCERTTPCDYPDCPLRPAAPAPEARDCQAPLFDGYGPVRCGVTRPCPDHDRTAAPPATPAPAADAAGEEEALMERLHDIAMDYDSAEWGLPIHVEAARDAMLAAIRAYGDARAAHVCTGCGADRLVAIAAVLDGQAACCPECSTLRVPDRNAIREGLARAAAAVRAPAVPVPKVVRDVVRNEAQGYRNRGCVRTADALESWLRATAGAEE